MFDTDAAEMMEHHPGLEEARARIERLEIENQIWRELIAEVREAAVDLAPVIWHSQSTERARRCMANPARLEQEVDKRLAAIYEQRAKIAVQEAAREAEAARAAQEAPGGEADEG